MAVSLNGIIATEDYNEDFLSDQNWEVFLSLAEEKGNIIVGRKTYESVKSWGPQYDLDNIEGITKVVLSHSDSQSNKYMTAISPEQAVALLEQNKFSDVLVVGGATVNTAFIQANLIDEIILNIEPVVIGKGIPLFAASDFEKKLSLKEMKQLDNGIVQLRYIVGK